MRAWPPNLRLAATCAEPRPARTAVRGKSCQCLRVLCELFAVTVCPGGVQLRTGVASHVEAWTEDASLRCIPGDGPDGTISGKLLHPRNVQVVDGDCAKYTSHKGVIALGWGSYLCAAVNDLVTGSS